jgi:hypothetical protein
MKLDAWPIVDSIIADFEPDQCYATHDGKVLHFVRQNQEVKVFFVDGFVDRVIYYQDGLNHRVGEPAIIYYRPDGSIYSVSYYWQGRRRGSVDSPGVSTRRLK